MDASSLREILISELASALSMDPSLLDPAKSFDEYGLDSIDAVLATGQVSERLGIELSPELLLQYRTLDDVIRVLAAGSEDDDDDARRKPAPVFLFSGSAGRDRRLSRMASRCLPAERIEIVSVGSWRQWIAESYTFDDLVSAAYEQVATRCRDGRLVLAGYSQGGQLAFGAAAALQHRDQRDLSLFILDSFAVDEAAIARAAGDTSARMSLIGLATAGLRALRRRRTRSGERIGRAHWGKRGAIALALLRRCDTNTAGWLISRLARAPNILFHGRGGIRLESTLQMIFFDVLWSRWRESMLPTIVLDESATLFRSQTPGPAEGGWSRCCSSLKVVNVGGDHITMFSADRLDALAGSFLAELSVSDRSPEPRADVTEPAAVAAPLLAAAPSPDALSSERAGYRRRALAGRAASARPRAFL